AAPAKPANVVRSSAEPIATASVTATPKLPVPASPATAAPAAQDSAMAPAAPPIMTAQNATTAAAPNSPAAAAPAPAQAAPQPATSAPPPAPTPQAASCPDNPNALGIARTVQIDTTGGPGFGFEHFKQHDFLKPGEVVLTFDDGPWLNNTPVVLAALAHH